MGDMLIRDVDDAVLRELRAQARSQGLEPESYAADLLRHSVRQGAEAGDAAEELDSYSSSILEELRAINAFLEKHV